MSNWGQRGRERDAVEEEESGAERHIHWKGLISEGDASKSDKKFWDILKTKVEWWGDGDGERGIREGCDTFRSRWCNGHSAEQVTETTGKWRGKDMVVDTRLEDWDSRNSWFSWGSAGVPEYLDIDFTISAANWFEFLTFCLLFAFQSGLGKNVSYDLWSEFMTSERWQWHNALQKIIKIK